MTYLVFREAKKLMRQIAKDFDINSLEEWEKFVETKDFEQFSKMIPKKPWDYYSKENVEKRLKKEAKK